LIISSLVVYLTCVFAYSPLLQPEQTVLVVRDAASIDTYISSDEKAPDEIDEVDEVIEVVRFNENDSLVGQGDKPATFDGRKNVAAAKVALTGIPHPDLKQWSFFTVGLNLLLGLFTLDMIFRGPALYPTRDLRFSRVGFVDSTSAKVLFREPDPSQLPIYAYYQREGQSTWTIEDKIYFLDANTDYTYPITFSHLSPSATYTYSLSNNLTGSFTTAPLPFSPGGGKLVFVTSSCIKANFPYNPLSHPLWIPGFAHLSRVLSSLPSPAAFMLFLGDFIYVDVPLRLASSMPHYRSEHRRVYASPSWSFPGLSRLSWLHVLDDHEIANDWSSGNSTAPFPAARDPFLNYHVSVNPPTPPSAPPAPNTTYFTFTRGPASFFMLDTRAYRTAPE
jgi:alkaline phosphatase D